MSLRIEPRTAAELATLVYLAKGDDDVGRVFTDATAADQFDFAGGSRFTASSGGNIIRKRTGFGVIAQGKEAFAAHGLIVLRGTDDGWDLLTDLNAGLRVANNGHLVHVGFQRAFESFEEQLHSYFRSHSFSHVHCIGHSLGGGLATLTADWITRNTQATPLVYTFGSPRVGTGSFSQSLTQRIGAQNIFRAYHHSDIISMVPVWPFAHVPQPGLECFIESPGAPGLKFHYMAAYVDSVAGHKSWDGLRNRAPAADWNRRVEAWLGSESIGAFTSNTLSLINHSIAYVLKKLASLGVIAAQNLLLVPNATLMDQLASMLSTAAAASKEAARLVGALIARVLRAMGKAVNATMNLTYQFVKWVFDTLTAAVYFIANTALRAIHRDL